MERLKKRDAPAEKMSLTAIEYDSVQSFYVRPKNIGRANEQAICIASGAIVKASPVYLPGVILQPHGAATDM